MTATTKQMVMRFGMSDKLGPPVFGHDHGQRFLGRELPGGDYSAAAASQIDEEIRSIIADSYDAAPGCSRTTATSLITWLTFCFGARRSSASSPSNSSKASPRRGSSSMGRVPLAARIQEAATTARGNGQPSGLRQIRLRRGHERVRESVYGSRPSSEGVPLDVSSHADTLSAAPCARSSGCRAARTLAGVRRRVAAGVGRLAER